MKTALAMILALAGCAGDETLAAFTAERYQLTDLLGAPYAARATLDVSVPGEISGQAPCNRYFASQSAPYPWFEVGPIGATRSACSDLALETAYLAALARMTIAEASGGTLILSNDAGEELVFQALP